MTPYSDNQEIGVQPLAGFTKPVFCALKTAAEEEDEEEEEVVPQPSRQLTNNVVRRKKLQLYLRSIKHLVKETGNSQQTMKLSTLEALEKAVELIRSALANKTQQQAVHPISPPSDSTIASQPSSNQQQSGSTCTSPCYTGTILSQRLVMNSPNNSSPPRLENDSPEHISSQSTGRQFLGSLVVSLPDGTVSQCQASSSAPHQDSLAEILRPGDCLLDYLHGKGAQTLLLNAFCGHAKRRMYARLKWGHNSSIRACEFMCEFNVAENNAAVRIAHIQVFCVRSSLPTPPAANGQLAFTTRHNASCALIFVDSASIPILGHFPSEITGKSLFALIHAGDVEAVKQAHQQLHETCGAQVVSTPGLRLITYNGGIVRVDSEWSAFVNPWTHQIEMIVSRHVLDSFNQEQVHQQSQFCVQTSVEHLRQYDSFVHNLLSKPVPVLGREKFRRFHANSKCSSSSNSNFGRLPNISGENNRVLNTSASPPADSNNSSSPLPSTPTSQDAVRKISSSSSLPEDTVSAKIGPDTLQDISLSYNQINCLENVHRLLKSQSKKKHEGAAGHMPVNATQTDLIVVNSEKLLMSSNVTQQDQQPLLTRELLNEHNRKWEEECKDSWRKRLTLKRIAQDPPIDAQPTSKIIKTANNGINGRTRAGSMTPSLGVIHSDSQRRVSSVGVNIPMNTIGVNPPSQEPPFHSLLVQQQKEPYSFAAAECANYINTNSNYWTDYLSAAIQAQLQIVCQQFSSGNQSVAASQSLIYAMLQSLQHSAANSTSNNINVIAERNGQPLVCENASSDNIYHSNPQLHSLPHFQ